MRSILLAIACAAGVVSAACPTWVGQNTPYAVGTIVAYNGQNYKVTRTLDNGWINPSDTWFWTSTTETCPTATASSSTATLAAVASASVPKTLYVTVEGVKQGKFKGEASGTTVREKIEAWNLAHTVTSPRDVATGLPSGKRQHGAITITKPWGPATPQFFQALVTNETLKRVLIEYYQTDATGVTSVVGTILLTNATVSNIVRSTDVGGRLVESISFTYQRIELEDKVGKTMAMDDWKSTP